MLNEKKIEQKKRIKNHLEMIKKENENRKLDKIAPKDSTISIQHVNKIYDNHVQAVYDFNLEIKEKEFIVFVGPSGCGKSTTLRMIAGLEDITAGDLYIDKIYANNLRPKDRNIAMVFQNYALYPNMTVYDNMAFSLKIKRVNKEEIKKRVEHAAKILGIEEYLSRKPAALSGGQRQRVALGRAIVRDAKIFLMDEPLSNLDAKLRVQMRSEIVKIHNSIGATTIYVTHDQTEAMTMASRIVVMKDGYIQQIGTPKEIYSTPSNVFVATFIGSPAMNMIDSVIDDKELKISDDIKIKLNKAQISKVEQFYLNEVNSLNENIKNLEDKLKERKEELRYLKRTKEYNKYILKKDKMYNSLCYLQGDIDDLKDDPKNNDKIKKIEEKMKIKEKQYDDFVITKEDYFANTKFVAFSEDKLKSLMESDDIYNLTLYDLNKSKQLLKEYIEIKDKKEKEVIFGIRPEHIFEERSSVMIDNKSDFFDIKVTLAELLGNEYFVHFNVKDKDFIAKIMTNKTIEKDDDIKVTFSLDNIHVFDKISSKRIL